MKRILLIAVLLAAAIPLPGDTNRPSATPARGDQPVGRYQIIAGTVHEEGTGETRPLLIKLDTATGETWGLFRLPTQPDGTNTAYVTGWARLFDNAPAAAMNARGKLHEPGTAATN